MELAGAIARARAGGRLLPEIARELGLSTKQARRYELVASYPAELQRLVEARLLSMAHAQILAEAGVPNPGEWSARAMLHRWSERELRNEVLQSLGRPTGGRKRIYVRHEDNALRVYAFRISRSAPTAKRQRVIRLLEKAIEFLWS